MNVVLRRLVTATRGASTAQRQTTVAPRIRFQRDSIPRNATTVREPLWSHCVLPPSPGGGSIKRHRQFPDSESAWALLC